MEYEKHPAGEYVLDTAAAAAEIPCSPNTLKKWRCTGEHIIPYIKPAGRCFYHPADEDHWNSAINHTTITDRIANGPMISR